MDQVCCSGQYQIRWFHIAARGLKPLPSGWASLVITGVTKRSPRMRKTVLEQQTLRKRLQRPVGNKTSISGLPTHSLLTQERSGFALWSCLMPVGMLLDKVLWTYTPSAWLPGPPSASPRVALLPSRQKPCKSGVISVPWGREQLLHLVSICYLAPLVSELHTDVAVKSGFSKNVFPQT